MIKCILVDDEKHIHNKFKRIAGDLDNLILMEEFYSYKGVVEFIAQNDIHLVFLDINMPGKNGLELAQDIMNYDNLIEVVFLTAYDEYAIKAFELNVLDYLLKPLTSQRLLKTLERVEKNILVEKKEENIEIQCFGDFIVKVDESVVIWKNKKAKELLAYLVHKNGLSINWEQIAGALWQEKDYKKAHVSVNVSMFRLRKILSENGISGLIESSGYTYNINKKIVRCDYYDFLEKDILPDPYHSYFECEGYGWTYEQSAYIDRINLESK